MIYVDDSIFPFRGTYYCHMWSDTSGEELQAMARKIHMSRSWFQNKPGFPHYDLSPQRRAWAIREGAQAISCEELLRKVRSGNDQT